MALKGVRDVESADRGGRSRAVSGPFSTPRCSPRISAFYGDWPAHVIALLIVASTVCTEPASGETLASYTFQAFDVPGAIQTRPTGINNRGEIVGSIAPLDPVKNGAYRRVLTVRTRRPFLRERSRHFVAPRSIRAAKLRRTHRRLRDRETLPRSCLSQTVTLCDAFAIRNTKPVPLQCMVTHDRNGLNATNDFGM